jgi:hypothetical protein
MPLVFSAYAACFFGLCRLFFLAHATWVFLPVRPEGLEPSTFGTGIQRSIQLNYGRNIRFVLADFTRPRLSVHSLLLRSCALLTNIFLRIYYIRSAAR